MTPAQSPEEGKKHCRSGDNVPSENLFLNEGVTYLHSGPRTLGPQQGRNNRAPEKQPNTPCIIIVLPDIIATAPIGHCELRAHLAPLPCLTMMSSQVPFSWSQAHWCCLPGVSLPTQEMEPVVPAWVLSPLSS